MVFVFVDESVREACGVTLHAINQRSPDVLKRHAALALPLAFLAMHQNNPDSTYQHCQLSVKQRNETCTEMEITAELTFWIAF